MIARVLVKSPTSDHASPPASGGQSEVLTALGWPLSRPRPSLMVGRPIGGCRHDRRHARSHRQAARPLSAFTECMIPLWKQRTSVFREDAVPWAPSTTAPRPC